MNGRSHDMRSTLVAGFGSPHGDDQAGWRVATMLSQRPDLPALVVAVREPTQVLAALGEAQRAIIVDACHTDGEAGAITRFTWPDPRIAANHSHSTHGVGVVDLLLLAEKLGGLPPLIEIVGIEIADCSPGRDLTPAVVRAVAEVESMIANDLCEVAHA